MSGVPLRVLSYNVHGLRDDRAALTELVREAAPDVVIVQEAPRRWRWRHKCAALADDFGMVVAAGGLPSLGNLLLVSLRVRGARHLVPALPADPGRRLHGAALARCSVRGGRVHRHRFPSRHRSGRASRPGGAVEGLRCRPWRVR